MAGLLLIAANELWARHGLVDVGDCAVEPAAHLVAKDPETRESATPDWTLDGDTPFRRVQVGDRPRGLDHKSSLRHRHHQGRVVKVQGCSMFAARLERFVNAAIE